MTAHTSHQCNGLENRIIPFVAPLHPMDELVTNGWKLEQIDYSENPPIVNQVCWVRYCPFCGEKLK